MSCIRAAARTLALEWIGSYEPNEEKIGMIQTSGKIGEYVYIYIYLYEGPLGHIMHMLAARDFIDLKDLQE